MGEFKSKIRDIESERKGDIEREKRVNKDTTVKQSFYGPVHSTMLSFYCPTKASFYGAFSPHTRTHTYTHKKSSFYAKKNGYKLV